MPTAHIRHTPDGRTAFELTPRRTRLSLLALLALAVAAAAAAVASSPLWLRAFFGFVAFFFGSIFLTGLPNLFQRGGTTLLTIGDQGLEIPRSGLIPWTEIEEVGQTHVAGQRAIGIWTTDPYFAARHGPWYLRPFALLNRRSASRTRSWRSMTSSQSSNATGGAAGPPSRRSRPPGGREARRERTS